MADALTLPPQVAAPAVTLDERNPHAVSDAEVIALPVLPGDSLVLGPGAAALGDALTELDLLGVLEAEKATGKAGQVVSHVVPGGVRGNKSLRRILLVGVGAQRPIDFRRAGVAVARATRDVATVATTIPALEPDVAIEPFVVGVTLASFSFDWRASGPASRPVGSVVLAELGSSYDGQVARANAVAAAGWRSRFLATVPSNVKNPAWLAEQAVTVADEAGLKVKVWDEEQLAKEGFGGILGVGSGSATPPRLIRLDFAPRKASRKTPTVVLVGKGITFDTGGLNLKPGDAMTSMKRDMTGGAIVLSTMAALAAVDCPVRVVGLIAAAENAVSGSSMRPGDVLRHYPGDKTGRTSEVTNTDAEGRLVLADAMAYAVTQVKPDVLVDVATLTGGIKVALGQQLGGLFANHDLLAAALEAAGEATGEPLWRMPLSATYEDKLASSIADADNGPGGPQAITAALFLQHFAGGLPWAHLDLASVGDVPADRDEWTKGPSGWGARTLLTWLGSPEPLAGIV
ncbi:leucyl aminopeptidase family protein [Nocardioides sp. CER19]|uniref:leucyl aminopeptidase family protein n=1 Tax=Nocardioides sp. CER19 TaxID=3038538 RepID=UPI00244C1799|nr:leucyl aminopeptidase family protein [Nocardioides sp. CER19]MDH2415007.1 leucyl aminopeptidase family protein [Nocardioides sp. CER19]